MPIFDAICDDCEATTRDLIWWPEGQLDGVAGFDEPCAACGSTNLRKSFDFSGQGLPSRMAAGSFEPIRALDHLTGEYVVATSQADLQHLADRQAKAEGKPPGTYVAHVRSEGEMRERRDMIRQQQYDARRRAGMPTERRR